MDIIGQIAAPAFSLFLPDAASRPHALAHLPLALLRSPPLPPSLRGFLFETHWAWWVVLAVIGIVLLYRGRAVASTPLIRGGTAVVAVAVVWAALAMLINTPGERLYAAHKAMAAAAAKGDADTLVTFLADDFRCPNLGIDGIQGSRDQLAAALKTYNVKGSTITYYKTATNAAQDSATVNLTLITETDMGAIKSSWRLVWRDVPGQDWRIREAQLTALGDQPVGDDFRLPRDREHL